MMRPRARPTRKSSRSTPRNRAHCPVNFESPSPSKRSPAPGHRRKVRRIFPSSRRSIITGVALAAALLASGSADPQHLAARSPTRAAGQAATLLGMLRAGHYNGNLELSQDVARQVKRAFLTALDAQGLWLYQSDYDELFAIDLDLNRLARLGTAAGRLAFVDRSIERFRGRDRCALRFRDRCGVAITRRAKIVVEFYYRRPVGISRRSERTCRALAKLVSVSRITTGVFR